MSRSRSAILIAFGLSIFASGCCSVDRVYRPTECCGSGWDPIFGSCDGGIADSCGGGDCACKTPSQAARHAMTCGAGCGEVYWGEWLSDPPDDCDPCDHCGNWIGPRCCPPAWWEQFKCGASGLWGWRCGPDACHGDGGCGASGCDGGCNHGDGHVAHDDLDMLGPSETIVTPRSNGVHKEEIVPARPGQPRPAIPRTPESTNGPTEAQPERQNGTDPQSAEPTAPGSNTSAMRSRTQRHPSIQPHLLQPARTTTRVPTQATRKQPRPRNI